MDYIADSESLTTNTTVEGPVLEQELSLSSSQSETKRGGTILLQLLEFKTHLLEAVEELHIRRDAETRFEDQFSKLVLEKQELEWDKESLQQQIETVANQHRDSLTNVKNQFQAKVRNIEEEKGKYQVSAELKDREINNLKEELKSLQLLKYNLEKKSSELEQKLALQSRAKDSHLNQLVEVEKRFSALSRHCATVRQAHEKLGQNVDEAMRINKKLSSVNEKQETTIVSLKKELEEVSKQLIKAKMTSVRPDKIHSPKGKDRCIQQLHQKLNMETEMNRKLREENVAVRAEMQEVVRALQHAQQLLLKQTETVSRVELELKTQREQNQALKQEDEVMREKSKAVEDKVAQLMESYTASKTCWDKEKTMFLDHSESEQQELQAVKEAYDELHQKHAELSSQAKVQAQRIFQLEMRGSSQGLCVSTEGIKTLVDEPVSTSELCIFGSLQHLSSSQTKNPGCLEDTGVVTKLDATGATGEEEALNYNQRPQFKQTLIPQPTHSETDNEGSILNKFISSGAGPDVAPSIICISVSDDNLLISEDSGVSSTLAVSSSSHRSTNGSVGSVGKDSSEEGNSGMNERKHGGNDVWEHQKKQKEEEKNTEQPWNREEVLGGDVNGGGSTREKREVLVSQTTDRADRREDNKWSAEDAGDKRNAERDRAEREGTDGAEERGRTALCTSGTPETQIPAQTTADTTIEKCSTRQFIDLVNIEPPQAVSEPSDCSQSLCSKVTDKDADFSHANKDCVIRTEEQLLHTLSCDGSQSVGHGPDLVLYQVQNLCHDGTQTQDTEPHNQQPSQIQQKTTEDELRGPNFPTEHSESLNHSSLCCTQTNTAPLVVHTVDTASVRETSAAQTVPSNPSDIKSDTKQTEAVCDIHVSQEISSEENQRKSLGTAGDAGGDSSEGQLHVHMQKHSAYKTVQEPLEDVTDACGDIIVDPEYLENDKIEDTRDEMTTESETDLTPAVHPTHENDESAEIGHSKCDEQLPATEKLLDTDESSLPRNYAYRSSFDWSSAQRKTAISRTMLDISILNQLLEETEQNTSWTAGNLQRPPSTIPLFLRSKHNKVPLVITRASDLLNASSVSGTAASSRRPQQGEWKTTGESFRESTAAESRGSLSKRSFPVSASCSTASVASWMAAPGTAPTSAAGLLSEADWEPSCSLEREDQQSSLKCQISKIEQFLNKERLRLPKRRRTDN